MKYFPFLLSAILFYTFGTTEAQDTASAIRWKQYFNMSHYLEPFWKADTIYDEKFNP